MSSLSNEQLAALTSVINARFAEFGLGMFDVLTLGEMRVIYGACKEWEAELLADNMAQRNGDPAPSSYDDDTVHEMLTAAWIAGAERERIKHERANGNGTPRQVTMSADTEDTPLTHTPPDPIAAGQAAKAAIQAIADRQFPKPPLTAELAELSAAAAEKAAGPGVTAEQAVKEMERAAIDNAARREKLRSELEAAWPDMPDLVDGVDRFAEHPVVGEPSHEPAPSVAESRRNVPPKVEEKSTDSPASGMAKDSTASQIDAETRAEQYREIIYSLQEMSVDGSMPSTTDWNNNKPAHLPGSSTVLTRYGFLSWGELARRANLEYYGKGPRPQGRGKGRAA